MTQNTTGISAGQTRDRFNSILLLLSAVADLIGISSLLALCVKSDPILVFLITMGAIGIAYVFYRFWSLLIGTGTVGILTAVVGSLLLMAIAWSLLASSGVSPMNVSIIDPQDGATVSNQNFVKGTLSDPDARVYVLVHPVQVAETWVQQPPIVDGEGKWKVQANFGTENLGIGEQFEVIALAVHDNFLVSLATGNSLREGQKLKSLPRNSNRSNLVTVTRVSHR